jgi:hypothetical protein
MTYFHKRSSTIIGAKAFHCPVRDGKEWYHLAMVVRRNFLSVWELTKHSNLVRSTVYEERVKLEDHSQRILVAIGPTATVQSEGVYINGT